MAGVGLRLGVIAFSQTIVRPQFFDWFTCTLLAELEALQRGEHLCGIHRTWRPLPKSKEVRDQSKCNLKFVIATASARPSPPVSRR
jgi:hypothetical protein